MANLHFQQPLLQSPVSQDPSEIIWYSKSIIIVIITVENGFAVDKTKV